MSLEYEVVRGILEHYTSDKDTNPTIIGIQLAGRELLLTAAGKSKYENAMKPNDQRIGIKTTDELIKMPKKFSSKTAGALGSGPIWVLDSEGLALVREFLKSYNPQYTLN